MTGKRQAAVRPTRKTDATNERCGFDVVNSQHERRNRRTIDAVLVLAAVLSAAGCAGPSPAVSGNRTASAASAKDAPDSYTAATTYAKLAPRYPFIRIADRAVPPSVRALTGIVYASPGGQPLRLDLYLPVEPAGGAVAGIVLVHGGGWRVGVRENLAPLAIGLARRGYAAATIDYRLSTVAPYPAAIQDAKAAVRWMRANAGAYAIDPGRIAIGGASAGGQIAGLAGVSAGVDRFEPAPGAGAAAASSAVQAIVNIDGLSDFTSDAVRRYEDDPAKQPSSAGAWFGGRYADKPEVWRDASPLYYVDRRTPPIAFIASAQARFSLGRDAMTDKLAALGIPTRTWVLPDTPHSFWLFDPWLAPTVRAAADFLDAAMPAGSGR